MNLVPGSSDSKTARAAAGANPLLVRPRGSGSKDVEGTAVVFSEGAGAWC